MDDRPFVLVTVEAALHAGCTRILVANNWAKWDAEFEDRLAPIEGVEVFRDPGFTSTFQLVRHFLRVMDPTFLFLYGHAPRPSHDLGHLRANEPPAVSAYRSSTMRHVLQRSNAFIEPPYFLDRMSVARSAAQTWADYFHEVEEELTVQVSAELPEANTEEELRTYAAAYARRV